MQLLLENLDNSSATVNSNEVACYGKAIITIPSAHDGTSTEFDTATAYIQVFTGDDAGRWVDYADGNSNEQISSAISRSVEASGHTLRVQFRSVSGSTVIPAVYISGEVGKVKQV